MDKMDWPKLVRGPTLRGPTLWGHDRHQIQKWIGQKWIGPNWSHQDGQNGIGQSRAPEPDTTHNQRQIGTVPDVLSLWSGFTLRRWHKQSQMLSSCVLAHSSTAWGSTTLSKKLALADAQCKRIKSLIKKNPVQQCALFRDLHLQMGLDERSIS